MKTYTKTNKTWLPIFTGFYNTIFEADESSEIFDVNNTRTDKGLEEKSFEDFDFDYKEYNNDISKACTSFIEKELKELGLIEKIVFENLVSPKEYNFTTDSINIEITFIPEKISEYINENKDEFSSYLKREYTSRDGFSSFHSIDFDVWKKETENFTCFEIDTHKLGATLTFICENEEINESDMHDFCTEKENVYISATNYDELIK